MIRCRLATHAEGGILQLVCESQAVCFSLVENFVVFKKTLHGHQRQVKLFVSMAYYNLQNKTKRNETKRNENLYFAKKKTILSHKKIKELVSVSFS